MLLLCGVPLAPEQFQRIASAYDDESSLSPYNWIPDDKAEAFTEKLVSRGGNK
jgi:hypothetical protein